MLVPEIVVLGLVCEVRSYILDILYRKSPGPFLRIPRSYRGIEALLGPLETLGVLLDVVF